MTVEQDEALKAVCHGIVVGAVLPVLAYNIGARNLKNVLLYLALEIVEGVQIARHVRDARSTVRMPYTHDDPANV